MAKTRRTEEIWQPVVKIASVWVREATDSSSVSTEEGMQQLLPGDVLCRGQFGEVWPQSRKRLQEKYSLGHNREGPWAQWLPRLDYIQWARLLEAEISLYTPRGTLIGDVGDYLLAPLNPNVDDLAEPEVCSLWVVAKEIFANTYRFVTSDAETSSADD